MAGHAPANDLVATDGNVIKMLVQTSLGTTFITKARPDVPVGDLPGVALPSLHSVISSRSLLVHIMYMSLHGCFSSVHFSYAILYRDLMSCAEFLAQQHQCLHRDHGYVVGIKVQFTIKVDGVRMENVAVQPDITISGTFASFPFSFCL